MIGFRAVRIGRRTRPERLARELADALPNENVLVTGFGSPAEKIMAAAAALLAHLEPEARYLRADTTGHQKAWWWALRGTREQAIAAFNEALWRRKEEP